MELIIVTLDCGGDFAMHKLLYEKYFNNYKTFKLLKKGSNVFEEYELICDKSINVTVDREKLTNSRVIYKISNDFAKVILEDDKESSQLGECSVV